MKGLIRWIARRYCGHGEAEIREIERRLHNAQVMQNRVRRFANREIRRRAEVAR